MRQTNLFTKTQRDTPADEVSKNAQLLLRGGFIHKEFAGVYSYLPLGLRVLKNIEQIIREEMDAIGGQELLLAGLQSKESWEKSGRWNDEVLDVWFKTKLKNGTELGLATTHEEPLTNLMVGHIRSYKDLPAYPYQFQTKYRNEKRAKSGVMRTREFIMKDLYSFNRNEEDFRVFYEQCAEAYMQIFKRTGIGEVTYRTFASGGSFSKFSDEFQTITDAGEDTIYIDRKRGIAINEEVYNDEVIEELKLTKNSLEKVRAVEVGNIFPLGTKFSEALGLVYKDEAGVSQPVYMGSYGIGPGRLMGTIAETFSHDKGIYWPESVAPFKAHIILVQPEDAEQRALAEKAYAQFTEAGIDTLIDDRQVGAGEKFADSELIGIPHRITIGKRALETQKIEYIYQSSETAETITTEEAIQKLSAYDKET